MKTRKYPMKKKINLEFFVVALIAVLLTLSLVVAVCYQVFQSQVMEDLRAYAHILDSVWPEEKEDIENSVHRMDNLRLTVIGKDGQVEYDSEANENKMENHSDRPEIEEAFEEGEGEAIRKSETMDKDTFYYALRLNSGEVLRVAREAGSVWNMLNQTIPALICVCVIILLLCMILGYFLTKSLIRPIETMAADIDNYEEDMVYEELRPFVATIKKQHEDVLQNARIRQEFTANVSHELKTPLTAISGYSELIENGMAKGEEALRFAKEIHHSSNRLLTLINDVIHLSELDSMLPDDGKEPVDLYEVARACLDMLQFQAEKHQVNLALLGVSCTVLSTKQKMEELVYNLCDNAIRYNNEGGSVYVTVRPSGKKVILSVKDTGIGIPKEHQERIFERFYRVDKSRSKSTGGTGLGLAIVKHIIAGSNASIELDSDVGKGTEIRVIFYSEQE